jgi:hypothetical protein
MEDAQKGIQKDIQKMFINLLNYLRCPHELFNLHMPISTTGIPKRGAWLPRFKLVRPVFLHYLPFTLQNLPRRLLARQRSYPLCNTREMFVNNILTRHLAESHGVTDFGNRNIFQPRSEAQCANARKTRAETEAEAGARAPK